MRMNNLIPSSFLLLLTSLCLNAQNIGLEISNDLNISQEIRVLAQISSEPMDKVRKMPNGQSITMARLGGTKETQNTRYSEISIRPKSNRLDIVVNVKRIKNKSYGVEIDTDTPFSSDPRTKASLDYYMEDLGKSPKIEISKDNLTSPKPVDATFWHGPFLNPIHELSGVILNKENTNFLKGQAWQDSVKGIFNSYITSYVVKSVDTTTAEVTFTGFLEKGVPEALEEDDSVDMVGMIQSGQRVVAKIVINSAKYSGTLTVDKKSLIISELKMNIIKEQLQSRFGNVSPQTVEADVTITNEVN